MRTYLFILCLIFSGLLLATNTHAEAQTANTSSSTPVRDNFGLGESRTASSTPRLEERLASSTERREDRQEIRNERQAALNAARQQRVLNLSANMSNRMDAAIVRLYNIIARLETRIQSLKNQGVDTAQAETKLREAANSLSVARSTISNIDKLVNEATTSTEPQNRWMAVRNTYQTAGLNIRSAHQALRETVTLLKAAISQHDQRVNDAVKQGTSSPSTTSELNNN